MVWHVNAPARSISFVPSQHTCVVAAAWVLSTGYALLLFPLRVILVHFQSSGFAAAHAGAAAPVAPVGTVVNPAAPGGLLYQAAPGPGSVLQRILAGCC